MFSLHRAFGVVLVFIAITLIGTRCVLLCVGFVSCAACKHSVLHNGFQISQAVRLFCFQNYVVVHHNALMATF